MGKMEGGDSLKMYTLVHPLFPALNRMPLTVVIQSPTNTSVDMYLLTKYSVAVAQLKE